MNLPRRCSFRLVGVTFADAYPLTIHRVTEALANGPVHAHLERVTDNPHDPNAVAVHCDEAGGRIGWVPAAFATRLAAAIDNGSVFDAEIVELAIHPKAPLNPGLQVRITARATDPVRAAI